MDTSVLNIERLLNTDRSELTKKRSVLSMDGSVLFEKGVAMGRGSTGGKQ